MPKLDTTSWTGAAAAAPPASRTITAAPAIAEMVPGGRRRDVVNGKMRHEKLARLLGITVALGRARWMAAAAAGDAGSSPGTCLAADRAAGGLRAAVAAAVRGRARARSRPGRPGRHRTRPDRRGPGLEAGHAGAVRQGRPLRRSRAADGAYAGARSAEPRPAAADPDPQ